MGTSTCRLFSAGVVVGCFASGVAGLTCSAEFIPCGQTCSDLKQDQATVDSYDAVGTGFAVRKLQDFTAGCELLCCSGLECAASDPDDPFFTCKSGSDTSTSSGTSEGASTSPPSSGAGQCRLASSADYCSNRGCSGTALEQFNKCGFDVCSDCECDGCKEVTTTSGGRICANDASTLDVVNGDDLDANVRKLTSCNKDYKESGGDIDVFASGTDCRDNWEAMLVALGCPQCVEELDAYLAGSKECFGAPVSDCSSVEPTCLAESTAPPPDESDSDANSDAQADSDPEEPEVDDTTAEQGASQEDATPATPATTPTATPAPASSSPHSRPSACMLCLVLCGAAVLLMASATA